MQRRTEILAAAQLFQWRDFFKKVKVLSYQYEKLAPDLSQELPRTFLGKLKGFVSCARGKYLTLMCLEIKYFLLSEKS